MARELSFSIGGEIFTAEPCKLDRKKLYGWREKVAYDDDDKECSLISMSECGTIVIPAGGTGLGYLTPDDTWVERGKIKMANLDGSPALLTPSSFSRVNVLNKKVTPEDLLDCAVEGFYRLNTSFELIKMVGDDIYQFDYCFRDSYDTSSAFLLVAEPDSNKELFMLIGSKLSFEPIGYEEVGVVDDNTIDSDNEESEDLDFAMF